MSPQYQVAKQCLQLLRVSGIASPKKLRLEIQLVQLLRLLLHEDLTGSENGPLSTEAFQAVCTRLSLISHDYPAPHAVTSLTESLGGILTALSARSSAAAEGSVSA